MKTHTFSIRVLTIFVAMTACTKTPEACISASKPAGTINDEITFTSCSKDADENQFYAYDGTSVTGPSSSNVEVIGSYDPCTSTSITYKFNAAGTYIIELNAKNRIRGDCNNGTYRGDKITTSVIIMP